MPKTTLLRDQVTPIGSIQAHAGDAIPNGWVACDGSTLDRSTYSKLFAAIGTAHGEGDGSTTFHIPDLRGRFLRGADGGAGRDPDAAGRTAANTGGNTGDAVGSIQNDDIPSHNHSVTNVYWGGSNNDNPENNNTFASRLGGAYNNRSNNLGTSSGGGSTEARPANASVKYIIKVQ